LGLPNHYSRNVLTRSAELSKNMKSINDQIHK